jgi:hypothetical protein
MPTAIGLATGGMKGEGSTTVTSGAQVTAEISNSVVEARVLGSNVLELSQGPVATVSGGYTLEISRDSQEVQI